MPLIETKKYVDIAISNNAFLYSLNNEEKTMYDGTKINYYDYGLQKKGKIFNNKNEILNFIQNKIGNNNYLMVKGSNSTGLNTIVSKLKSI